MIILHIDAKKCMTELLLRNTFDSFSLVEGEITTFNKFTIDGYIRREFFEEAPDQEYSCWKGLREYCFSLIRGKRTPLNFKFILALPRGEADALASESGPDYPPNSVRGLFLNFHYSNASLTCTTGTSLNFFTMDKSLEYAWDKWAQRFFSEHEIPWEPGTL